MEKFDYRFLLVLLLLGGHGSGLPLGQQEHNAQPLVLISREPTSGRDVTDSVDFLLWTRENSTEAQTLKVGDLNLLNSTNFNKNLPTKILVHGYRDTGTTGWVLNVKTAYLNKEPCNVISVDWRKLADTAPFYNVAAANSKPVGYLTADLVYFLVNSGGTDLSLFHAVGFSLGAQVTGHLGYKLQGKIPRITGLDPAGFLFHTVPPNERLDQSDALFVDVLHSAGLWIGSDEELGHVDFYPNSGKQPQPGCDKEGLDLDCSHQRAPALFLESISSDIGFKSFKCSSWIEFSTGQCDTASVEVNYMGEPADQTRPGVYFLRTNARSPFAIPTTYV